ncbi:ATP-binding protein [Streptomyces sp. DK15]|uniref:ATP-binding protein n=1 Tax=Streptomyces sp. DK15 TaxID=2957499 RepID=UPI0029A20518|nr:ATP-binding protein [Streptomyces sp. DK15]MDX2394810.1 ATP-binding protein [Streptomyces sp. DK15]
MGRSRGNDEPGGRSARPEASPAPSPAPPPAPLPVTAADARTQVAAVLRRAGLPWDPRAVTDALMVTTELVTNAIRHGGGLAAFHADVHEGALRVSVADHNPQLPITRTSPPAGSRIGGYGWPLVQSLAAHLSVTTHGNGKLITADLKLH